MNKQYCGYISIVGKPNVGKSTLLNSILDKKISITSRKSQTTRNNILGVKTDSEFLHGYTLGILNSDKYQVCYANHDIYNNSHAPDQAISVQTFYEKMYLDQNKPISYIKFKRSLNYMIIDLYM